MSAWTRRLRHIKSIGGVTKAELDKLDGIAASGALVQMQEGTITETAAGTYTLTLSLPAGSTIVDIAVHGIALWTAATSASLIVGDGVDPDGFFAATDLKATDLLAGEANTIEHPGGLAGAFIVSEQRKLYQATARDIIAVVTSVGAGTAGRTRVTVTYATPTAVAAIKT